MCRGPEIVRSDHDRSHLQFSAYFSVMLRHSVFQREYVYMKKKGGNRYAFPFRPRRNRHPEEQLRLGDDGDSLLSNNRGAHPTLQRGMRTPHDVRTNIRVEKKAQQSLLPLLHRPILNVVHEIR
jgi:hypothetical protein